MEDENTNKTNQATTAAGVMRIINRDPLFCDERTVRACFKRSGFPALFSLAFFNHAKETDVSVAYMANGGEIIIKTYATPTS